MTTALVGTRYENVLAWQNRMAARGWDIAADGLFGPQSASVAARFAAEKGLATQPGEPFPSQPRNRMVHVMSYLFGVSRSVPNEEEVPR